MGHEVLKLRELLPTAARDEQVLRLAAERDALLVTCNRDDFLAAARRLAHRGIIILIRCNTRARERAALVRLVDRAGELGLRDKINFA